LKQKFIDAYKACEEIHDAVLEQTRPGADCEAIFLMTLQLAEKLGYEDSYLGPPGLQTPFIAHGIGLELNEFPFVAKGQPYPLEKGMSFALEPKIVFPGEGSGELRTPWWSLRRDTKFLPQLQQVSFKCEDAKSLPPLLESDYLSGFAKFIPYLMPSCPKFI